MNDLEFGVLILVFAVICAVLRYLYVRWELKTGRRGAHLGERLLTPRMVWGFSIIGVSSGLITVAAFEVLRRVPEGSFIGFFFLMCWIGVIGSLGYIVGSDHARTAERNQLHRHIEHEECPYCAELLEIKWSYTNGFFVVDVEPSDSVEHTMSSQTVAEP